MTELNVGDVVSLKSGGPAMTVVEIFPKGIVGAWFDEGVLQFTDRTKSIPFEALELIKSDVM